MSVVGYSRGTKSFGLDSSELKKKKKKKRVRKDCMESKSKPSGSCGQLGATVC